MLWKVLLIALLGTCLAVYFKEQKNVMGTAIVIAASLLIVFYTMVFLSGLGEKVKQLLSAMGSGGKYLMTLFKMLGITYVCDLTAGICKDAGNASIAHQLQIFGKLLVISLSVPILSTLMETVSALL